MSALYQFGRVVVAPVLRRAWHLEVTGAENVPKHGPVIVAANHHSFIDSTILPMATGRQLFFLAKDEYFQNPVTRFVMKELNQIKVDRSSGRASLMAIDAALPFLFAGKPLGIFPEGTRSPDGRLYRGRPGVAKLALDSGAPIVPVGLFGTEGVQPIGKRFPGTGRVRVVIGKQLDLAPFRNEQHNSRLYREIAELLMRQIAEITGQEYVGRYARRDR
ncbi:1-acyl-sn-glycerol-3-phosphate acyltransferase [Virgisporangium aliadipatigenens]|uniref:1-acyl-sn-glycerol-3-phosphate acyltransferase n=1 Tax=Virgisporangium aliadipatigenens TaxID=741659 RepID=A0A8J3YSJ7_9ACTN|nr:lysophospholipid acyltransferase family protein [Virgisporangium aliadipatigenens]GIJ49702.1 1-acyl-sn-glycerol-3-phosphate acyltransferase [Virgisporangium aliadipatigenens]